VTKSGTLAVYCDPCQSGFAKIFWATHHFGPNISDSQSILKAQGLNELATRMSIWGKSVLDPDDMKRIRVNEISN